MPKRTPVIEIYQDSKRQWRAKLKAGNREIVATTEPYVSKAHVIRWARSLKRWMAAAEIVEV